MSKAINEEVYGTHSRRYGYGTYLIYRNGAMQVGPVGGRVMAPDGKLARLRYVSPSGTDTFFSIPAAIARKGKDVAGYITIETAKGFSSETDGDPAVVKFVPYQYSKNKGLLPEGKWVQPE